MEALLVVAVVVLSVWVWIERQRRRSGAAPAVVAAASGAEIELRALDLSGVVGAYDVAVVGESSYQPELRRLARSGRTFRAVLIPEPTNPYDPKAIRVCAEGGKTIGYFSRDYAVEYREAFELLTQHGYVAACGAKLIGGIGDKRSFGVVLNLKDVETILTDVRDTLAPGTIASSSVQPF